MVTFRRPNLFDSWLGLVTWSVAPSALLLGAAMVTVKGADVGQRLTGAALAAAVLFICWRRFAPRVADMRAVVYRTRQGVAVVARDGIVPPPREQVEAALDRAIAAHGHREALDGYGLLFAKSVSVLGVPVHGVCDAGWLNVAAPTYQPESVTLGLVTHEASHALLIAAGLPVPRHHSAMAEAGTL